LVRLCAKSCPQNAEHLLRGHVDEPSLTSLNHDAIANDKLQRPQVEDRRDLARLRAEKGGTRHNNTTMPKKTTQQHLCETCPLKHTQACLEYDLNVAVEDVLLKQPNLESGLVPE
jgi:hypothetical protein